ncbi:MAG: RdgB/HAM1 family non-canonical purine NTP pyrophosphatase [Parachlamydiales bacterium]|nr:RdgB/HAM1 family non-canonical purine NTP pyrophosphatase [Parachlamydiales bacterium]
MRILMATCNLHKIREYKEMFKSLPHFDLLSLKDFPNYKAPPETGITFIENALIKAQHASEHLKIFTIADDSGLVVPSLGKAPGVFSARYAGENATDAENRTKLLKELAGKSGLERAAYYEVALAVCSLEAKIKTVTAICEGVIVDEERGKNGFGYDSLFMKHDYHQTFGELDDSVKNRVSHRRKAFEKLLIVLESAI